MGLFEQRFSDEQVAAARRRIADGWSLRAAAAEIGCAPSTLSVRITKAEAAEAAARVRLGSRARAPARAPRAGSQPPALDALGAEVGPVEVLRGALQATKANGQPDWQIRVSAARALAALPSEEAEPEPECATFVYDLPPGSSPILHCAPPPLFAPLRSSEPPAQPLPEPGAYLFNRADGVVLLVQHASADGSPTHFLDSPRAAAELLRAFGGDPGLLDTSPDANPRTHGP